jgi:hypothetical protein
MDDLVPVFTESVGAMAREPPGLRLDNAIFSAPRPMALYRRALRSKVGEVIKEAYRFLPRGRAVPNTEELDSPVKPVPSAVPESQA